MKKLAVIIGFLLVVALLLPASCAAPEESAEWDGKEGGVVVESPPVPTVPSAAPAPEIIMPEEPPVAPQEEAVVTVSEVGEITERMIVRTGRMWLVVDDVPIALERIGGLAEDFDGYVVSSKRWEEDERLAGTIAIRVPVEYFDDVMRALRGLAVEVTAEDTSSKDVTEEYVDLSAKLRNLEATEEQLLRLMEKAETVEEMLGVQRELSRIRGEIEQTKGRMQYLERTSATSLIEVHLGQAKLDISFIADKRRVKEGEEVQFTIRQIAGGFAPYSYEWDLGDDTTSTEAAPTHSYNTEGDYTVSLTVTDDRGNTDTETREDYILVHPGWSAGSTASGAWNGLVTFGHVLATILIWIGILCPVWIVIGGIVYYWRRRRRRKAG
jgi:hypothetical protein